MHRSSDDHRARQTPHEPVRLPGRMQSDGACPHSRSTSYPPVALPKLGSAISVTVRIRRRVSSLGGQIEECALSFLSLFRRHRLDIASAGNSRGGNDLREFPERCSERDPFARSAGQNREGAPTTAANRQARQRGCRVPYIALRHNHSTGP